MTLNLPLSSLIGPSFLTLYAAKKKSLTKSALFFAFLIAWLHAVHSVAAFVQLALFFVFASRVTKVGKELKEKREDNFIRGLKRNWVQVLSNGGASALFCIVDLLLRDVAAEKTRTFLFWAYLGALMAASSDTFSSEIGILHTEVPREILNPFREVPPGSNGGVTLLGFIASLASGILFAIANVALQMCGLMELNPRSPFTMSSPSFPFSLLISLLGSAVDSILGNLFEYSGWDETKKCVVNEPGPSVEHLMGEDILDGNQVNFLACFITGIISGWLALKLL